MVMFNSKCFRIIKRFMKKYLLLCLFIGTAMFANAQTYTRSDLQKYVAERNAASPIKTSTGDLILNATLVDNALYETTVMDDKSSFNELQSSLAVFKQALINAYANQIKGRMLADTRITYVMIWVCKDATYPPFQIVIRPEELKAKM